MIGVPDRETWTLAAHSTHRKFEADQRMQYSSWNADRFHSPESCTMLNAKPPRNLTPALCQRVPVEMLKARQDVAARHGLVFEARVRTH